MILNEITSERLLEIIRELDNAVDSGGLTAPHEQWAIEMRRSAAAELTRRHHQGATEANQ